MGQQRWVLPAKENDIIRIHTDLDYCGDLHEMGGSGVLLLLASYIPRPRGLGMYEASFYTYVPNRGCPGYCLANVRFANCIRQPERKLQRPIYNQDLALGNH